MRVLRLLYGVVWFFFAVNIANGVVEIPCTKNELPCDGGGCIPKDKWCDSLPDCEDGSDEQFCAFPGEQARECLPHHYKCNDGMCIPMGAKCDNSNDCNDGSDELAELCGYPKNQESFFPSVKRRPDETAEIVKKAEEWLLSQRDEKSGWGAETARAVTALFLLNSKRYHDSKEGNLIKKQLAVHISSHFLLNKTRPLGLARLANFVNAVMATCQDPRSFQGLNLVQELRIRTNEAMQHKNTDATPPLVLLTLCVTGASELEDFLFLDYFRNFSRAQNKTDLEAVTLMAMSCLAQEKSDKLKRKSSDENMIQSLAGSLAAKFQHLNKGEIDQYTTALVIQALNTIGYERWNKTSALRRLISSQDPKGSFKDILGTYHALLALTGKGLISLKYITCPSESFGLKTVAPRQNRKEIKYSLWLGNPVTRTHTLTLTIDANWTVIDVMSYAADENKLFSFHYEETPTGPSVYSIANIPNDAERELQWSPYLKSITRKQPGDGSNVVPIDLRSKLETGDTIVLWYKGSEENAES